MANWAAYLYARLMRAALQWVLNAGSSEGASLCSSAPKKRMQRSTSHKRAERL